MDIASLLFDIAIASFVFAAILAVLSIVLFFRLRVLDAVRFLRGKPIRHGEATKFTTLARKKPSRKQAGVKRASKGFGTPSIHASNSRIGASGRYADEATMEAGDSATVLAGGRGGTASAAQRRGDEATFAVNGSPHADRQNNPAEKSERSARQAADKPTEIIDEEGDDGFTFVVKQSIVEVHSDEVNETLRV